MDNPGVFQLGAEQFTTANTYMSDWVDGFEGAEALDLECQFAPTSGGTTAKVYVQTRIGADGTAFDVACFAFTTTAAKKLLSMRGVASHLTLQTLYDAGLPDDTAIDGMLGDQFRIKVVTTGTYGAGSAAQVLGHVR